MRRCYPIMLLTLAVVLAIAGTAHAQSQSLYWERFDVNITVLPNGDFVVEEIQEITFTSGEFHFGYRNIPMDRLDSITGVEVWEGDRRYGPGSGGEYTFETSVDGGDFVVKWYFPYTSNSSHTFILRYTVQGGLRYYEGGDQLYWKAVYADREFPVYHSTVTVRLPGSAAGDPVAAYGTEAAINGQGSSTLVFTAQETVDSGQELEVRVQFPHGIVQGATPEWQEDLDRKAEWEENTKPLVDLGLGLLGALLLIGGPLVLVLLWYLRGRDPQVSLPADYLTEPPSGDRPGMAGTLVDEKADMEDIIATLVDLARRGYLTIEEERKSGLFGASNYEFTFRRTEKPADDLLHYERKLLSGVFGRSTERSLSDLRNRFYKHVPKIKRYLYEEIVKRGYFRASPEQIRNRYIGIGIGALVATCALGICLFIALSDYTAATVCPAIGIGITAIGIVIVGQFMPAKSRQGAEQAARWRAFKRYLKEIERYTDLSQATDQFEKYLPYAIAFGLDRDWVSKFSRLKTVYVPMPTWYMPTSVDYDSGGRAPGLGKAARGGGAAPSLQSMSDGLSGGLQGMSDGLTSMLNSAGKTFASSPSSSGSGGGFSGGGGGGGGGAAVGAAALDR